MSGLILKNIKPVENEFIAEETLITITSNVDHPIFSFISGSYGPLVAGLPSVVPLWFAITLRKKGKCTIAIPEWMSVESLENYIETEREAQVLQPLPFHYIEISKLLLTYAREDIILPDKISALLQDLENIRMDRIKMAIQSMADSVKGGQKVLEVKVVNISAIEIFSIKGFITESMQVFKSLTTTKDDSTINYRKTDNDYNNTFNQVQDKKIQTTNLRKFREK